MSEPKPIRVLQIFGGMRRGGAETWMMNVLRRIDRSRFRIDFLVHTPERCPYDDEIEALGSRVLPCLRPSEPLRYARNFARIVHERGGYDVIHSHVFLYSGLVLKLARRQGIAGRIAHIYPHEDLKRERLLRGLYRRAMTGLIARHATTILSGSRTSLDAFLATGDFGRVGAMVAYPYTTEPGDYRLGRDAGELRRSFGLPIDRPIIVYLARFAPHKNHAQMIRIADRFRERGIRAHFVMAGSHGALLDHYLRAAEGRDDLSVLVDVSHSPSLLAACDLFFFPSLNEGFGIVASEASAAGLPVVATDLPTIREASPPANADLLFPPDDDDRAAELLTRLLHDPARRRAASDAALRWAEANSVVGTVRQMEGLYESAASRPAPQLSHA